MAGTLKLRIHIREIASHVENCFLNNFFSNSLTTSGACSIGKVTQKVFGIGHFGKYHNTLCLSPQILHKHCFQFLLGFKMVPRENKNNTYAKFGGTNKEYYGIFRSGLWRRDLCTYQDNFLSCKRNLSRYV